MIGQGIKWFFPHSDLQFLSKPPPTAELLNPSKIALTFWNLLMCRLVLGVHFGNTEFALRPEITSQ